MPRTNPQQILAMTAHAASPAEIAQRLRCSERTVYRVLKQHDRKPGRGGIIGSHLESAVWLSLYLSGALDYAKIAFAFGVSRQRVRQTLATLQPA